MSESLVSKILGNQRGQGMVSNLVAGAVVATTAAGTASLVHTLATQSRQSQIANRAIVQQSQIVAGVLRKEQFVDDAFKGDRKTQIATIKAGGTAKGFNLVDPDGKVLAVAGSKIGIERDGSSCSGTDCPLSVEFDMRCYDLATSGCFAAYRVTINPIANEIQRPSLGAPARKVGTFTPCANGLNTFSCLDYNIPVSYEAFAQSQTSACKTGDVFAFGINKATGQLRCARKAATECKAGEIAKNIKLVYDKGSTSGHLEMDCMPMAQPACPANYVFERLEVRQLDPRVKALNNGPPDGVCRYRWRDNIDGQVQLPTAYTSSGSVSAAAVCNSNVYDAVATTGCGYKVEGNQTAGNCPGNNAKPQSKIEIFTQKFDKNQATVTCGIRIKNECGSSVRATPTWTGKCRVKSPYLTALTVAPEWTK